MRYTYFTALFFLLIVSTLSGQDINDGISLLNEEAYEEAALHFEGLKNDYPEDITIAICHLRAKGLAGDSPYSLKGFLDLHTQHPDHEEISLNLAEAYIWNNMPGESLALYKQLDNSSSSKKTTLGMAMAYAKMEEYGESYVILKKLVNDHQEDQYLLDTYQSIAQAYAHQLKTNHQLTEAINILDGLIEIGNLDASILSAKAFYLLENKSNSEAKKAFENIIDQGNASLDVRLALAYCHQIDYDFKNAHKINLETLQLWKDKVEKTKSRELYTAVMNTALLLGQNKEAEQYLEILKTNFPGSDLIINQQLLLHFNQQEYDAIAILLNQQAENNSLNKHRIRLAIETTQKLETDELNLDTNVIKDEEMISLLKKLDRNSLYEINLSYQLAQDNASTKMTTRSINIKSPRNAALNWSASAYLFGARSITNELTTNKNLQIGLSKSLKGIDLNSTVGIGKSGLDNNQTPYLSASIGLAKKIGTNQRISAQVSRQVLDLNPILLKENLIDQKIGLSYQASYKKLHFYNQLSRSNNGNIAKSTRLFADISYHISDLPIISTGLMTTLLRSKIEGELDILPESLNSYTAYIKWSNEYVPNTNWKYILQTGIGTQQINGGYHHLTSFATADLSYQQSNRFSIGLQVKLYKNDISGIYAYNFNSIGINARLLL